MKNKNIVIISTYPKEGTMNIGDALITNSLIELLDDELKSNFKLMFQIVWRGDNWENVRDQIEKCDFIVFACLAIRKNLADKIYPYLNNITKLNKKVLVISAGTSLKSNIRGYNFHLNKLDFNLLQWLNENSIGFTSRALLTQLFCDKNQLKNVWHSGDIAFYDKRFDSRKFQFVKNIESIIISDPHYAKLFIPALKKLIYDLKVIFPQASISINLHGKNPEVEVYARREGIKTNDIFNNPETGLDNYDEYDIHVGFRIHGHISMLKRRKPSYLIEQDGRGKEYGITLNRKISTKSNIQTIETGNYLKNLIKKLFRKNTKRNVLDLSCIDEIIAMISYDKKSNFKRFLNFEKEILDYNNNHKALVNYIKNKI